jgi:hypothetical protein
VYPDLIRVERKFVLKEIGSLGLILCEPSYLAEIGSRAALFVRIVMLEASEQPAS